jgi:hypothetical protein
METDETNLNQAWYYHVLQTLVLPVREEILWYQNLSSQTSKEQASSEQLRSRGTPCPSFWPLRRLCQSLNMKAEVSMDMR